MKKENKLKEAAQILKEEIEASGAWGGHEFAVSYLHDAYDALKNVAEDCGLELSETDMRRLLQKQLQQGRPACIRKAVWFFLMEI